MKKGDYVRIIRGPHTHKAGRVVTVVDTPYNPLNPLVRVMVEDDYGEDMSLLIWESQLELEDPFISWVRECRDGVQTG